MPYRRFLLFNAAGGILWAVSFGLLGAAFGSQWPLIERWAGRAGLLIAALVLLILLAGFLARWAIQHETELRARWAAFLAHPKNVAFARLATDVAQRQRWGKLTYAAAAIAALTQFEPVPITVHVSSSDGTEATEALESTTCQALQLAVVNLPLFGGALQLRLPGAVVGSGLLNMIIIEALEPPQLRTVVEGLLAALSRLAERGGVAAESGVAAPQTDSDEALGFALPGVRRYTVRAAIIETPRPVEVTLDGEVRARTPVLARVAPEPPPVLLSSRARAAPG